jgi:hypothetical protein
MKLSYKCALEDRFGQSARTSQEAQRVSRKISEEEIEMRYRTYKHRLPIVELSYFLIGLILLVSLCVIAKGQSETQAMKTARAHSQIQQPLYNEYRGLRLGMTSTEVRAKLGEPALKSDEQDFYVISPNETAQIAYNREQKVVIISTDYTGGVGAPDYRAVVGEELLQKPDGSLFRMVTYKSEHFWVSYNKSANTVSVVTITISAYK